MPMMAPDVRYAVCRYDLSKGPVRLRAQIADGLWLIAFYTPLGENFYAVVGADMKQSEVDLIIATVDQTVAEVGVEAAEIDAPGILRERRQGKSPNGPQHGFPGLPATIDFPQPVASIWVTDEIGPAWIPAAKCVLP